MKSKELIAKAISLPVEERAHVIDSILKRLNQSNAEIKCGSQMRIIAFIDQWKTIVHILTHLKLWPPEISDLRQDHRL